MREYYFLFELGQAPYDLCIRDCFHMAVTGALPCYLFIANEILLTDDDSGHSNKDGSFYLGVPPGQLCSIEQNIAHVFHTSDSESIIETAISEKHELLRGTVDGRYYGVIPSTHPPIEYVRDDCTWASFKVSSLGFHPYLFSVAELIFWTSDLEELAKLGRIQRRENGLQQNIKANDNRANIPSKTADDESEIKRLQRTVAALALGLAAKPGTYNKAGRPNVSQLAKLATEHLRDATSDRTPPGFSDTVVRNTITAALKACPELKG